MARRRCVQRDRTRAASGGGDAEMEARTMSATKQQLNREKVARCLQQHPGERLRVERITRAAELTYQQASIALCSLLNDGLLPGLTRPGRGTYQWNPSATAAS